MPFLADGRKVPVDPLQVAEFGIHAVGSVDEVAEFDDECWLLLAEVLSSLRQFAERFPVMT